MAEGLGKVGFAYPGRAIERYMFRFSIKTQFPRSRIRRALSLGLKEKSNPSRVFSSSKAALERRKPGEVCRELGVALSPRLAVLLKKSQAGMMKGLDKRLKKLQGNLKAPQEEREVAAEKKLARERASIILQVRSGAISATEGSSRLIPGSPLLPWPSLSLNSWTPSCSPLGANISTLQDSLDVTGCCFAPLPQGDTSLQHIRLPGCIGCLLRGPLAVTTTGLARVNR